jgi:hypothetical protein
LDTLETLVEPNVELLLRRLPACLGSRLAECSLQQTKQLQAALARLKTRGPVPGEYEYYNGLAQILASELSDPDLNTSALAAELLERPEAMSSNMFGDLHYARAGLAARTGDTAAALGFLEQSFLGMDGGILNRDVFGLTVEESLLLDPLRGEPEFEGWLSRYQEHRKAMQQRMQNLESRGEILSIATAERMATQ